MSKKIKLFGDGIHDDTKNIQKLLDKRGLVYIPDGKYLISKPLIIYSDTHFKLASNATLKLADYANCSLLDNEGLYNDTFNQNITIEGGIWDGNHNYQERQKIPNEGRPCDENEDKPCEKDVYISNIYTIMMMRLVHTKNLCVKNLTYKDPTSFAVQIADTENFVVENITLDYSLTKRNMDGIHIQGPARFGYIHNIFGNGNDDHVALCSNGTIRSAITRGPIENITIDGIYCDNGYTGVRLLSRGDPLRNVSITNVHGSFRYYAVSFTHHYPLRDDMPILLENVSLSNLFISKSDKVIECQTFCLPAECSLIWFEGGINCKNVVIDKVFRKDYTSLSHCPTIYCSETANVENLTITNLFEQVGK